MKALELTALIVRSVDRPYIFISFVDSFVLLEQRLANLGQPSLLLD
jgi:hypothetical protein